MTRYTAKPIEINAMQWTGENTKEVKAWVQEMLATTPVVEVDGIDYQGLMIFATRKAMAKHDWDHIADKDWGPEIGGAVYDYLSQNYVGVRENDYLMFGTKAEFYPCDPGVFEHKYEAAW